MHACEQRFSNRTAASRSSTPACSVAADAKSFLSTAFWIAAWIFFSSSLAPLCSVAMTLICRRRAEAIPDERESADGLVLRFCPVVFCLGLMAVGAALDSASASAAASSDESASDAASSSFSSADL